MIAHSILVAALLLSLVTQSTKTVSVFDPPIDALSVELSSAEDSLDVRGWDGGTWTRWFPLAIEEEFDPLLRESNLVIFPHSVSRVKFRGGKTAVLHPIRVAKDPVHTLLATRYPLARRIVSRKEWGADNSLLFAGKHTQRSDVTPERAMETIENGNGIIPERLRECEAWQREHPEEFRSARTVREDGGEKYRWPLQYSQDVKLLVVHHTAQNVAGDERPPLERVRALYAYHANSRGWGDIGYHYLIDERGQIYEGRFGGRGVIGGHAYCWNTGTISIAMLGNFDIEQPPQIQMQSLQWLLADLARTYDIDLGSSVRMHGKNFPAIVGHRDLLSTDCPGYYVRETLTQVREHVWRGNLLASIRFPRPIISRQIAKSPPLSISALVPRGAEPLLSPMGITQLQGRPGAILPVSIQYRGGIEATRQYATIADVEADSGIYIWQERGPPGQAVRTGKRFIPVRGKLQMPHSISGKETAVLRLKVQLPTNPGEYRLTIGPVRYTLLVAGKRAKALPKQVSTPLPRMPTSPPPRDYLPPHPNPLPTGEGKMIRIRLTFPDDTAILLVPDDARVNGVPIESREVLLTSRVDQCIAEVHGKGIATGTVRIESPGPVAFADTHGRLRRYSGVLECRSVDRELVLINELPLEDYLLGLAEEPDTELFEKQKAFAIAARSYAAHYLSDVFRKFPGLPYDGSDDPALFQAYEGLLFAEKNPSWVRAVRDTAGKVLMKNSEVIRAAYFSSDDGRTRSPQEAGWLDFPHAEVFASKPDPWCEGKPNAGHGVGMSGCGARGQAEEGKSAEEILEYYYPGSRSVILPAYGTSGNSTR